jgi:RecA-family ATPase
MGKSSLDMVEAVAMATGRNLLGEQLEECLRVWYHNGEDPIDEIERRLYAICRRYGITRADLSDRFFVTSGTEFPLRVAKGYTELNIDHILVGQIADQVGELEVDVVILDPLVTLHAVSEVDTGKMDAVIRIFAGISQDHNAACELAHHVRKLPAGDVGAYGIDDVRGVKAITDAVRAARILNRMTEREGAGCTDQERQARFRVDNGKHNYSSASAAVWRQFETVTLLNGDEVGVVTPWEFPGQDGAADTEASRAVDELFLELLAAVTARGQKVGASAGANYAPKVFSKESAAKAAGVSKAAFENAMRRLFDAKRIKIQDDGPHYRPAPRLVVV